MVRKFTQSLLTLVLIQFCTQDNIALSRSVPCTKARVYCEYKKTADGTIPFWGKSRQQEKDFRNIQYQYFPFHTLTSTDSSAETCQLDVSDFSKTLSKGVGIFTIVDLAEDLSEACQQGFAGLKEVLPLLNKVYGSIPKLIGIQVEINGSAMFHELQNAVGTFCQNENTDCLLIDSSKSSQTTKQGSTLKNVNNLLVGKFRKQSPTCKVFTGHDEPTNHNSPSLMAMILLTIGCFLTCILLISVACLMVSFGLWFCQRQKDIRSRQFLLDATKEVLEKIPVKFLNDGDATVGMDCVVCIDTYVRGDVVRILPCQHIFHKICVDLWLMDHRTCPLCKANILTAFGYDVVDVEQGIDDSFYDDDSVSLDIGESQGANQLATMIFAAATGANTDLTSPFEAQGNKKRRRSSTKSTCGSSEENCCEEVPIAANGICPQDSIDSNDTEVLDLSRCSSPSSTFTQSVDGNEMAETGVCWCENLTETSFAVRYNWKVSRAMNYVQEIKGSDRDFAGSPDSDVAVAETSEEL